jgi:Histidine kinase-, DNA gyrase B-, and HSP90-like ATPase
MKMSEQSEKSRRPQSVSAPPHIGAFVLETLTLGMYGEPRHTLREYVQNSYDAIRAAQRTKFLQGRGVVHVRFAEDSITIADNGLGVPAAQAWNTLTSIGASKKDRERDAGFRGIGRLAGMAYCDELIFRTSFPGETSVTIIKFECKKLVRAMNPDEGGDVELSRLLDDAIIHEIRPDAASAAEHFFEVTLQGLASAPENLKDDSKAFDYLSETVPVDFNPDWTWKERIDAGFRSYFGAPIDTIDVYVESAGDQRRVFKPYGDSYQHARGTTRLREVRFYPGEDNLYWGWVGLLEDPLAVTDWLTRGLRVRVRNIQVDGTGIMEGLFTDVKPSYGRFSSYYVGEIHIDPARLVPNARRDGFEENDPWKRIKRSLSDSICSPLAHEAYQSSRDKQSDIGRVIGDVDAIVERSRAVAESSRSTYDQVVVLMNDARRLRRKAARALKVVGELDDTENEQAPGTRPSAVQLQDAAKNIDLVELQAKMLIGRFLDEDERIAALRARIRQEIVQEVLDIVNAYVDPATYQAIKRHLTKAEA